MNILIDKKQTIIIDYNKKKIFISQIMQLQKEKKYKLVHIIFNFYNIKRIIIKRDKDIIRIIFYGKFGLLICVDYCSNNNDLFNSLLSLKKYDIDIQIE